MGFIGSNQVLPPGVPVPPGGILEISVSASPDARISGVCITEESPEGNCESFGDASIPAGTQLISTNPAVASVETDSLDPSLMSIELRSLGSTVLQLRQNEELLASYVLIVTPSLPGTPCAIDTDADGSPDGIVDCSGRCVSSEAVGQRLGDGVCDEGSPRDDGSPGIDLSCVFIPEFFQSLNGVDVRFTDRTDRDGGDCDPEASCRAQFGTAPDFELCSASAGACSFNATTEGSTCAEMCQRFGSRCVAALDNNLAGCTPLPGNTDTCETPRNSEICICERR